MFEVATSAQHRTAIERAHQERAAAFAAILTYLTHPFRTVTGPQDGARRLPLQPQTRPVGP